MPRYQSNLLNFFSRRSMELRDRSAQAWRQTKLMAVWGVQILLYPIYVGFQTVRLTGKQFRQTMRQVLPALRAVAQTVQPVTKQEFLLADTPVQRSLQLLDQFNLVLPVDRLALQINPHQPSNQGIMVVVGGSAIAQSIASLEGQTGEGQVSLEIAGLARPAPSDALQSSSAIQPVQGLASLLSSRKLVLVTTHNQLLDVLSAEQAAVLQRRMVGDIAAYWRQQRSQAQSKAARPLVDAFLPLPADRTNALLPIRVFWQAMTWMQTSSVAMAADLFQESSLLPIAPPDGPPAAKALRSAQPSWKTREELISAIGDWLRNRELDQLFQTPRPTLPPADARLQSPWLDNLFERANPPQNLTNRADRQGGDRTFSAIVSAPEPLLGELPGQIRTPTSKLAAQRSIVHQPTESSIRSAPSEAQLQSVNPTASDLAANANWIEAEVRLVAYEKHPLEQLLNWLDRHLSWVEGKVSRAWQWLRDRWSA